MTEIVVLSGGVGGARFVRGLIDAVPPADVTVIGNVGDDTEVLGLHVSPDLDSLVYTLAGIHDEKRGWGRGDETWNALSTTRDCATASSWPASWRTCGPRSPPPTSSCSPRTTRAWHGS